MVHAYNPRAQAFKSGGSEVESYPQVHIKFDWATGDPVKEGKKGERRKKKRGKKGNKDEQIGERSACFCLFDDLLV